MKEWLDCCMDVCSSYKYGSDIGLEKLSYQSKIISINIRKSLLLINGESETCPISEIAIIIVSLKFIGSFQAATFSFINLFFPPGRFSLLSSGRSLSRFAPTAPRKKKRAYYCPTPRAKREHRSSSWVLPARKNGSSSSE